MKYLKNLMISIAVSLLMLTGILGLYIWGNIIIDKVHGGEIYSQYFRSTIMDSPERDAFIESEIKRLLSKYDMPGLASFAEEYSLGYSITKSTGTPYASWFPEGKSQYKTVIDSSNILDFDIEGTEAPHVKIYIFYESTGTWLVWKIWIYIYSHPLILYGGILFWAALFVASLILLLSVASPIYKVWCFAIILLGGELVKLSGSKQELSDLLITILTVEKIALAAIATVYIIYIRRLRDAIRRINKTEDADNVLDVNSFPISLQPLVQDINSASGNIANAINEKMKSERLKTELISNVSHDIKTPLTSIINFSDLIYNEKSENPLISEYAEHLHNQSIRMKDMMDALIEAAKASSGAVDITLVPCKVSTLMEQCVIEYEDKLEKKKITLVTEQCGDDVYIKADAKAISRIMDNLLTNILKYGMPGSRAYIESSLQEDICIITVRNISADPIMISGDELTERFVRGDASRHSEGHGLGLSIVKSLMDLMDAKLNISAKADVFEARLTFNVWKKNSTDASTSSQVE